MEGRDKDRWVPAAHALRAISRHFAVTLGLDEDSSRKKAISSMIERLASGALDATPKGFLPEYANDIGDIGRWYHLWLTEGDGEKTKYQPDTSTKWAI